MASSPPSPTILLGALTTPFVPQSLCTRVIAYGLPVPEYNYPGQERSVECFPKEAGQEPFFFTPRDKYFSPAVCPSSFTAISVSGTWSSTFHSYVCCPSAMSIDTRPNLGRGCIGRITGTFVSYYFDSAKGVVPTTMAQATKVDVDVDAYSLQIQFQDNDFSLLNIGPSEMLQYGLATSTPSRQTLKSTSMAAPSVTSTSSPSGVSSDSSRGLRIGLGVGISVAVLFIIIAALFFFHQRRKRRRMATHILQSEKTPNYSHAAEAGYANKPPLAELNAEYLPGELGHNSKASIYRPRARHTAVHELEASSPQGRN